MPLKVQVKALEVKNLEVKPVKNIEEKQQETDWPVRAHGSLGGLLGLGLSLIMANFYSSGKKVDLRMELNKQD